MKLEVGMYVRTKVGKIAKIINKYDNSGSLHKENFVWVLDDTSILALHSQKVVKASHTLLGNDEEPCLIEVGDYVNGYKVSLISRDFQDTYVQCDYPVQEGTTNHYRFYEKAIYSIVTREQFESISYKVGD